MQARYDLAVDAIKTFHTGVSEDFLLKQDQFKELRDRLLKSAADFYGKLGALLGKETDVASRRALATGELRAGRPDRQGRPQRGRAGGAPGGAGRAARRWRPSRGPTPAAKADVGRSLTAVARPSGSDRQDGRGRATYRRAEALLAGLAAVADVGRGPRWRPAGRGWASSCTGRARPPRPWRPTAWRGPTRRRWPRPPGRRPRPGATWRTRSAGSASCWRTRASRRRRRPSTARPWRSAQKLADDNPAVTDSATAWRTATTTSACC